MGRQARTQGAVGSDQQVTLARALTVLFTRDLHSSTGVSPHTVASYKTTFRLLVRFLSQYKPELLRPGTPIELFDSQLLEDFLRHLSVNRSCSAATVNVRLAAFAALARSLMRRHPHLLAYCQSILAIRQRKTVEPLVGYFEVYEL